MQAIWVGASLVLVGLASVAIRRIRRAWLGGRSADPPSPPATWGADEPDIGFDLESNPCFALIALGVILVLAGLFDSLDPSPNDRSGLTAGADGPPIAGSLP